MVEYDFVECACEQAMKIKPFTKDRWDDFEKLFGPSGAYSGCWCMWWRITRSEFDRNGNEGNRKAMKALVGPECIPGILGYENGEPVGWCSVAPRGDYGSLNRSRVLKPIDDQSVWSIVCFFIHRNYRRQGVTVELIEGAVQFAEEKGAKIVEAYPTKPRGKQLGPGSSFMGIPRLFERVGFEKVADPSEAKAIMRYYVQSE